VNDIAQAIASLPTPICDANYSSSWGAQERVPLHVARSLEQRLAYAVGLLEHVQKMAWGNAQIEAFLAHLKGNMECQHEWKPANGYIYCDKCGIGAGP